MDRLSNALGQSPSLASTSPKPALARSSLSTAQPSLPSSVALLDEQDECNRHELRSRCNCKESCICQSNVEDKLRDHPSKASAEPVQKLPRWSFEERTVAPNDMAPKAAQRFQACPRPPCTTPLPGCQSPTAVAAADSPWAQLGSILTTLLQSRSHSSVDLSILCFRVVRAGGSSNACMNPSWCSSAPLASRLVL